MSDLAEAGHAAGQLTLLQGLKITSVQAIHGAPSHTPVEVVHSLSLQQKMALSYTIQKNKAQPYNNTNTCTHTHITYTHPHNHAVQVQEGSSFW